MTSVHFRRLVWKECRGQQSLWLALLAIAALVQLLTAAWCWMQQADTFFLTRFALIGPVFYLLAFAAMSYASEHENQTFEWLRGLPVRPRVQFWAKVLTALAGSGLLAATLLASALLLCWWSFPGDSGATNSELPAGYWWPMALNQLRMEGAIHAQIALTGLQILSWGLLCSLLGARVISTVVWTAVTAILGQALTAILFVEPEQVWWSTCGLACAVLVVDAWLAGYWYGERSPGAELAAGVRRVCGMATARRWALWGGKATGTRAVLGRLLWQQTRQSWRVCLGFAVVPLALALWYIGRPLFRADAESWFLWWSVTLATLCGASVFWADHAERNARCLVERGVSPATIWFSRQMFWCGFAMFLSLVVAGIGWLRLFDASPGSSSLVNLMHPFHRLPAVTICLLPLACYAVSQYCSLALKVPIIAWAASALGAAGVAIWGALVARFQLPWWLVACLPPWWLFASYCLSDYAFADEPSWSRRGRHALLLLLPATVIGLGAIAYRLYEIPWLDVSANTMQDGAEAASMGHESEAVPRALESAARYQDEGKLEDALGEFERALKSLETPSDQARIVSALRSWALAPGQTEPLLRRAQEMMNRLEDPQGLVAALDRHLFQTYRREWVDQAAPTHALLRGTDWLEAHLPWERFRRARLANQVQHAAHLELAAAAEAFYQGRALHDLDLQLNPRLHSWLETTLAPPYAMTAFQYYACHAERRAMQLMLALCRWRCAQGTWPPTLDALQGEQLDAISVDPFSGRAFLYFPAGWEGPLTIRNGVTLEAGTPFFWSAGLYARTEQRVAVWHGWPDSNPDLMHFANSLQRWLEHGIAYPLK